MKLQTKIFMVAILSIFIGLGATILSPQKVYAEITIEAENVIDKKMHIAVLYFDLKQNNWRTIGWYGVEANSSRIIKFPQADVRKKIYMYAHIGSKVYSHQHNEAATVNRTVIREAFSYYDGETCPDGNNRRNVVFSSQYVDTDNNKVYFSNAYMQ